jgi:hypothetical protein
VFADYLAMVGEIFDTTLATGLTSGTGTWYPLIAVTSVAIPVTYYWAKVLSLKGETSFVGVQFSNDGAILIAHSNVSTNEYIVIFNVVTGAVLSARSYSSNAFYNYNRLIKSMVISSGASPMAYVLSNYQSPFLPCTGQHFFKFDPTTFTAHPSSWTKKTTGTTNCGHQGLTFGRSESVLYAFSWFNSLSTVTLLDTAGNSIW